MMYWGHGMSGWGYVAMAASTLVSWVLLVAVIVLVVRYFTGAQRSSNTPPVSPSHAVDPQQLLAERFALGEIDEQEYMTRLATLRGTSTVKSAERAGG